MKMFKTMAMDETSESGNERGLETEWGNKITFTVCGGGAGVLFPCVDES